MTDAYKEHLAKSVLNERNVVSRYQLSGTLAGQLI